MKIPLDYFLYIIKQFLDDLEIKDASKVLKNHFEIPETEFVNFFINFRKNLLVK
jgi:hypothetical protein